MKVVQLGYSKHYSQCSLRLCFKNDFEKVAGVAVSKKFQLKVSIFDYLLQQLGPNVSNNGPNILFQGQSSLADLRRQATLH